MEENTIKVSVIIPVYNPGKGIELCLKCLQNQTLHEIEMIFVDDKGNDDALEKVALAARKDERIRILVNSRNMGSGPSRNSGIEAARGEYLAFIDPDDFVNDNFFELLYKKAESTGAEIVKGERKLIDENGNLLQQTADTTLSQRIREGLSEGKRLCFLFTFEHTTAIYKRELVLSSGARYGTSRNDQDTTYLLQICYATTTIEFEDKAVYYYIKREGSAVRVFSVGRVENAILAVQEKMNFLLPKYENCEEYHRYVIHLILTRLQMLAKVRLYADKVVIDSMQERFRNYILSFHFAEMLKDEFIVCVFLDYGINLSMDPYGKHWGATPRKEYVDVVRRWVIFLKDHPEYAQQQKNQLRYVFERAINYNDYEDDADRKQSLREIRNLARSLPDETVLTGHYVSMKLFVGLGINLFPLRESEIGKVIRKILRAFRNITSIQK